MEDQFKDDQSEFIQEEIIEKKKNRKYTIMKLGTSVLGGMLFGLSALCIWHMGNGAFESSEPSEEETQTQAVTQEETTGYWPEDMPASEDELKAYIEKIVEGSRQSETSEVFIKISQAYEEAEASIVTVSAVTENVDWFENRYDSSSTENGLIFKRDAKNLFILTGYDRLADADQIEVSFSGGEVQAAELVGYDSGYDIAVLSVQAESLNKKTRKTVKTAGFGLKEDISVADPIFAIGNVDGNTGSFATGYVSEQIDMIAITDRACGALISSISVNSSDPVFLFGMDGKVYGYHGSVDKSPGGSYSESIQISDLIVYTDRIMEGKTTSGLGITAQDIPESVRKEQEIPEGIYVISVKKDSEAYDAGLQAGDVISQIDGESVSCMEEYEALLMDLDPEKKVSVTINRVSQGTYKERNLKILPYGSAKQ